MKNVNSVSILGCGWLGFPLAKHLLALGYEVKGSTTQANKLTVFQEAGIDPHLIHFDETTQLDERLLNFLDSSVWVIAVPPGRTEVQQMAYRRLFSLIAEVNSLKAPHHIIFISSTSVYGDVCAEVDEETNPQATEASGILLLAMEERLKSLNTPYTIIRPGGLIGPERHPGRFFAGKSNIPNGLAPVNLIHLDDLLAISLGVIREGELGLINACAPSHPSRMEFYTQASEHAGFQLPDFEPSLSTWKIVNCKRLQSLEYSFIHPDLLHLYS